ncbi:MAG: putative toxin-antitoxin system toxin component, PIN family [Thermomicrobiales bacterium]|nr:putative toxin-antitoxin system toxin component, PIN family [Thermomicrobiales bacterium]
MILAVVDTNVLASAFVSPIGAPRQVINQWKNEAFELIVSEQTLLELKRTVDRPYFRLRLTEAETARNLLHLSQEATVVRISERVAGVATHPEDDLVLATAISGKVDYLVTGDRQLLKLREFRGVRIVSAAEFLLVLSEG